MKSLKCKIGLHDWDMFFLLDKYDVIRICLRCDKRQKVDHTCLCGIEFEWIDS